MENMQQSIQNLNMPQNLKIRINQFIKNQVKNNYKKSEICYNNQETTKEYICSKCRDLTFILKDNVATPCECRALRKAENYVNNFNEIRNGRNSSIIFMGQVGSGKTHLSMAIANNLMDSGISVIYMPFSTA